MILVDSSVWIDWFRDKATVQTIELERRFGNRERLIVGDLIATEVLRGTRDRRHFNRVLARLREFTWIVVSDKMVAIEAAQHFQVLRERGITIRKTIDTLIASRCIRDRLPLLYCDRDFHPFVTHRGLQSAIPVPE